MLKEQESRRPFDIHEYGREIIQKCIDVSEENKEQQAATMLGRKGGAMSLSSAKDMVKRSPPPPPFPPLNFFV
jgi:hypothetical protein